MTQDGPAPEHTVPAGVSDATVAAVGRLTEALEWVERARGRLYDFHQMIGHADLVAGDAVAALRESGHGEVADLLERDLVGRNVLEGRWTFQVVEEFDDTYYAEFRRLESETRDRLTGGRRHLHEARLKEERRTHGHPAHAATPAAGR